MLCTLFRIKFILYNLCINLNIPIHSHNVTDDDSWFCRNMSSKLKSFVVFFRQIKIALHRIALHCIASHRIASHRIASYRIVSCRVVSYGIVLYCIVSHRIGLDCIVLYCIVLYCIVLFGSLPHSKFPLFVIPNTDYQQDGK